MEDKKERIKGSPTHKVNRKLPIGDGGMFRVCEEFVDRFKNVPISGLQYDFFTIDKQPYPPFVRNSRIYSVLFQTSKYILIDLIIKYKFKTENLYICTFDRTNILE